MLRQRFEIAACIGVIGAALLAGEADAKTYEECLRLSANEYLAAIERGVCDINIETAAGPQQEASADDEGSRDGRNGGERGGNNGGGNRDGGKTGGGRAGAGRGAGKP